MIRKIVIAILIAIPFSAIAITSIQCLHTCSMDEDGYLLTKQFEGYSPFFYYDIGGVKTIGFGHAVLPGEEIKTPLMGPDALTLLSKDLDKIGSKLNKIIHVPLTARQYDAILDLAYNVGVNNVAKSTLLKMVNRGEHEKVPLQFLRWDHVGKKKISGLTIRRMADAALYKEGTQ